MITDRSLTRDKAVRTVQFYLLWGILFINVTAGIGILAQASPMMQDMFLKTPVAAAAVVSLISLFNAGGRFFWASLSDYIGRRNTYVIFFVTQFGLFLLIPSLANGGEWLIFESPLHDLQYVRRRIRYDPGVPADMFGPENVGAIHGALLAAWSAAQSPARSSSRNSRREPERAWLPAPARSIYDRPLQILACLLAAGFCWRFCPPGSPESGSLTPQQPHGFDHQPFRPLPPHPHTRRSDGGIRRSQNFFSPDFSSPVSR